MRLEYTETDVRAILERQREDEETPNAVLAVFQKEKGKPFSRRILAKLPGGEERWRIYQIANMTNIEDRDYRTEGKNGISLLVDHRLSGIIIDPDKLLKHNPAYFDARVNRNAKRTQCAADGKLCEDMARALTEYEAAKARLDAAKRTLDALTEYGEPFSPDQYEWQRACGAYEERRR